MLLLPTFSGPRERTLWVQATLRLKGSSFARIAERLGVSRNVVARTMLVPNDPCERAIADEIGVTQQALFSERYDRSGRRIHAVREQNTARRKSLNVKHHEVA